MYFISEYALCWRDIKEISENQCFFYHMKLFALKDLNEICQNASSQKVKMHNMISLICGEELHYVMQQNMITFVLDFFFTNIFLNFFLGGGMV